MLRTSIKKYWGKYISIVLMLALLLGSGGMLMSATAYAADAPVVANPFVNNGGDVSIDFNVDMAKQIKSSAGGILESFGAVEVTNGLALGAPPILTADETDNHVGQAVDLTFIDNSAWRSAIPADGITVNGDAIGDGQYTITAGNINIVAGVFDTAGEYTIAVKAVGYSVATVNQTIINVSGDTTLPVITLLGEAIMNLTVGDTFTEPGYTATDDVDGDITDNVAVGGDRVDTNIVGTYTITYNVIDAAGNAAPEVSRMVNVTAGELDTTAPVITLLGDTVIDLTVGDTFIEPGYTATDDVDGDITDNVAVGGDTVDTSRTGTYTITYNVSDAAENAAAEVSRTVNVAALAPPTSIGSPADLIAFAAVVNGGYTYEGETVALTADIDLTSDVWATITGSFNGIFDGDGHTISNPDATLFATIGATGVVRNLGITGTASVAGAPIALTNNGMIENCYNEMNVTNGSTGNTGGIVTGNATTGTIQYCFNSGVISGTWVGGITGRNYGKVLNCYNAGPITGTNWSGGIAGWSENVAAVVQYCYNVGDLSASRADRTGSIIGRINAGTALDCYYNSSNDASKQGAVGANVSLKTDSEMQDASFLNLLNGEQETAPWVMDTTTINGRYPILTWQAPEGSEDPGGDPTDTEAPTWPGEAVITPSDITIDGFTVTYTAADDNVGISRYKIEVSLGDNILKSGYALGLTKAFTGLADNTTYTCTVVAEDAAGNKSPALSAEITTLFKDVDAPTWAVGAKILVSDVTTSGFTVNYPSASDNVGGVLKYNVALKADGIVVSSQSISDLSIVFTDLDEATEYNITVEAEDAAGNKSAALTKNASTLQGIPTWGSDAKLVISNVMATDVTINWPYSNTPENVAGYALFVNGKETERFLPSDYYCDLGGLLSSTKYVFELKPFNKQGEFGEALSAMVVTDGAALLTFTTTFAVEEIAGGEYYKNYIVKYPIDLANFRMGWNFSNGLDTSLEKNLAGIRIYEKETGDEILMDKGMAPYPADTDGSLLAGDFRYTKSGGGDQGAGDATKLRLLIFEPSADTLAQFKVGIDYVLEMQPDFVSNNDKNTLSKITTFTFSVAPEDNEAPVWPEGALLEADKVGPESMVIKWPSATDNQILKEYWLTINEGTPIVIDAQAGSTYKLTGLTRDTLYAIRVEAVDAKNNKSVPLETSIRTLLEDEIAPTWPDGSKLTVKNIAADNADLLWTAADDNVEVTGYKVYNGDVLLAETTACQLHIIHLNPATTYVFRIEAVDQAGNESSTGPTYVIRTLEGEADTEAPQWNGGGSRSTTTRMDLSKTYVTLQWPWATDNVAVKGYQVYLEGELIATVSDTSNTYSGTLPLDGKYHNYEVYAYDAAGNSSAQPQVFSVLAGQVPDDLIAPYWPAGNEIIISDFTDKTAVISWSEAMDNKGVQSYLLKRDQLWVIWLNRGEDYPGYFQFTDTERKIWYDLDKLYPLGLTYNHPRANLELIEGVPYSCSLKAYDAAGNSSIGGPKLTFYPGTNPTAGSGIAFALTNVENSRGTLSSLTGAMNRVNNPTDPELTSFVFDFACKLPADYVEGITLYNKATNEAVDLTSENFVYAENGDSSQLTISPGVLAAEITYVIMFSKDFSSSAGVAIGFDLGWEFTTAKADKEIPTWGNDAALEVEFPVSPTTATLSWPAAFDNEQVTQYKVFKDDDALRVLPGDTREYLVENLYVATKYTFKVQAGDYLGNWSTYLEKTVTTPPASTTPPNWATGALTFTDIYSDNVTLNWSAAAGEYAVKEYLVYKNDESEPLAVVYSDILTYKVGGLTGETNYTFKIVAKDYSGNLSDPLSNNVTTAVDDVNPTWPANAFLNAKDLKSDSFTLYWQAALDNVGIGQYNIYQDGDLIGSTADGTITEYPVTGLEATTKYTFMVEAVDTSGNKTIENLVFEQSTTVSGPTEGAGIEFTMTSPANENVGKSGNTMLNRVTEPLLDTNVAFIFNFAKDLEASTWLSNIVLVKNDNVENPIEVKAEYFSYTFVDGTGTLKLEVPQEIVDMGASYQLKLMSSFAAKDGSTLNKDYIWEFNVAQGLYGIKDIAAGMNSYSAFERAADRFYLMVKSDGTVWGWGNNLYGHLGDGTTQDSTVPVQALNLQNIVKVVAGVNSAFAVDANGGVWGWGSNEHGQLGRGILPTGTSGRYGNETPQKIDGLPPIVKLVYGFNRCVALDINGDVWTWGFRTSVYQDYYGVLSTGTPAKVPFLSNIKDVAAGYQTSLAVTADGRVMEWAGIDGTPAVVDGLTEVKSVACDSFNYTKNNLVLKKDGTVWYWGEGTIVVTIPGPSNKLVVDLMQVEGTEDVKEIYTKSMAVLTNDRSVRSVNVDFESKTAVLGDVISNLTDISKLAVYTTSSRTNPVSGGLALKLDGTLMQFVADAVVPIDPGMDTVEPPVWPDESAVTFSNLTEKGLTLGWNSCGADISAYAVYQNDSLIKTLPGSSLSHSITGLVKGTEYTYKVEARLAGSSYTTNGPSASVTLTDWNPTMQGAGKIAAGVGHTLMIDADGNVWAWGANEFGQLGIGSNDNQTAPVKINGLSGIEAVAAGDTHSVALDSEGNVWVWGNNDKYQLGLGTTETSNIPVKLTTISGVKVISAAGNYNLAVKTDGTLWSWGEACKANLNYGTSGIDGQTPGQMKYGTPSPAVNYYYENVKSAAASRNFYAVLFADGTISRSGYFIDNVGARTYWTMLYNPGLMGVQAISAGDDFLMALLEDGTVAVLGDNSQGQFGNGTRINPTPATAAAYKKVTGLEGVVAISAGGAHGLALKKDGSVWGWGQNDKGQLGNGSTATQLLPVAATGVTGIEAIDAGRLYSIVLADDASASIKANAFGANDQGQLGIGNTVSSTVAKTILFAGYVDSEAPSFPAWFTIHVDWLSDNSARLIWTEATDNVGVTTYEIWRDNDKVGEVSGQEQTFTITGLIPGQEYEFGIKAKDAAGNSAMKTVIKEYTGSLIAAPALSLVTNNIIGQPVEIKFDDDSAWREKISIALDGIELDSTTYQLSTGKITLKQEVFTQAKDYTIVIKAVGYVDATVILRLYKPIADAQVNVDQNNKNLAITATTPAATITIPEGITDATINVAGLLEQPVGDEVETRALSAALTISADTPISSTPVRVEIPAATTVKAPAGWDGTINVPTVQANSSVAVTPDKGKTATVKAVIEVGFGDIPLTFSQAVKLIIPDQAGREVGYYRDGVFTKITRVCGENSQAWADANIPEGGDGKIDEGNDLVIWTKHFTKFVTYVQSSSGSNGGGGSGSGTPGGLTVDFTAVRTSPQDTMLQFDFSNGMDENLESTLGLIRAYEKAGGNVANYSDYKYIKEGNKDTGGKLRRLELYFDNLKSGTNYVVELGAAIKANNGSTLGTKKTFGFTTSGVAAGGQTPVEQGIGSSGGILTGNGVTVEIPAAALSSQVKVIIKIVANTANLPLAENSEWLSDVVEISTDETAEFKKPVIITLKFDKSKFDSDKQDIGLYFLDEKTGKWVALDNVKVDLTAATISGEIAHFTKFAVIATQKAVLPEPVKPVLELTDIQGHWAQKSIEQLVAMGAINGYGDGTFAPDRGITRAEFVTVLVKAFKLESESGKTFADTANHWAKQDIAIATAQGIINGYGDDIFGPDDSITREQMAIMIVKAAKLPPVTGSREFADSSQISSWATVAIATASHNQLISGYEDNTYRPQKGASRAEAVTVILNSLQKAA
ncbi:MAG: fibronectin type III domain-containing protein [Syntrophomonadaceae bacterium]